MFTRKLEAIQAHHIPTHIRHQIINKHNIIEIQFAVPDVDEEEYHLVFSVIDLTTGAMNARRASHCSHDDQGDQGDQVDQGDRGDRGDRGDQGEKVTRVTRTTRSRLLTLQFWIWDGKD